MTDWKKLKVGYSPLSADFSQPGDRRRFCHYAESRGVPYEIADPSKAYDLVVVTEGGDLSVWSDYRRGKVVFDFVDPYLSVPRTDPKGLLRGLARFVAGQSRRLRLNHWKALEEMCRRADAVICSTEEQRRTVLPFCHDAHIILDSHAMYEAAKVDYAAGDVFQFVWEGLPHNLVFFREIEDVLRGLASWRQISLHLVTALRYRQYADKYRSRRTEDLARGLSVPVRLYEWNERTCPLILAAGDLALIPVPLDDPFAAGRPENKLLLLWRMGVPTIVSATPAYSRAMAGAGLSMACRDAEEWRETLEKYMDDEEARRDAGRRGRDFVEANHGQERLLAQWDELFQSVLA
jgi:glycosyltransferase involved in cell wall biosynthesis